MGVKKGQIDHLILTVESAFTRHPEVPFMGGQDQVVCQFHI
jgi:hypothetical protein